MFYGEHLCADEALVRCPCGISATVEVFDKTGRTHGWFCREHSYRVREDLRKLEKIARAIVSRRP